MNRYASASINSSDNDNSSDSNSITPKDIEQGVSQAIKKQKQMEQ